MKKVMVTWRDITARQGWHTPNKLDDFVVNDKENVVVQLGFLYEEDENQIVLLDSYFPNETLYGAPTKIPKGCIISVDLLDFEDNK